VRGQAAEFGIIAAKGTSNVDVLLRKITETGMPEAAKTALAQLGQAIAQGDEQLAEVDRRLNARHKSNELSQRLATIPGIGPIIALTLSLGVDFSQFESGRHFSAWLGLTPRDKSTGGRQRFGGISRAGNERLRQLLVVGATAVIRHAKLVLGLDPWAGWEEPQSLAAEIAGAQAAQTRGGSSGQQDGPHGMGHGDERYGLSHVESRLIVRRRRKGAQEG
jgi:transposase